MGFGPATGPTLKTALFQICTLVERVINTEAFFISSPVVGLHLAGHIHLGVDLAVCASALDIFSGLRGLSPRAFTPLGGVGLLPGT